ncbi:hypothetical protein [Mycoplasma buteonis]|uniref:hypothetical protein n=1 Tax=Mycoplasma buteonis TaxID=171280 RepID=UPI000563AC52|nr:hypothetical protein [Mycoplasma buteonis]
MWRQSFEHFLITNNFLFEDLNFLFVNKILLILNVHAKNSAQNETHLKIHFETCNKKNLEEHFKDYKRDRILDNITLTFDDFQNTIFHKNEVKIKCDGNCNVFSKTLYKLETSLDLMKLLNLSYFRNFDYFLFKKQNKIKVNLSKVHNYNLDNYLGFEKFIFDEIYDQIWKTINFFKNNIHKGSQINENRTQEQKDIEFRMNINLFSYLLPYLYFRVKIFRYKVIEIFNLAHLPLKFYIYNSPYEFLFRVFDEFNFINETNIKEVAEFLDIFYLYLKQIERKTKFLLPYFKEFKFNADWNLQKAILIYEFLNKSNKRETNPDLDKKISKLFIHNQKVNIDFKIDKYSYNERKIIYTIFILYFCLFRNETYIFKGKEKPGVWVQKNWSDFMTNICLNKRDLRFIKNIFSHINVLKIKDRKWKMAILFVLIFSTYYKYDASSNILMMQNCKEVSVLFAYYLNSLFYRFGLIGNEIEVMTLNLLEKIIFLPKNNPNFTYKELIDMFKEVLD